MHCVSTKTGDAPSSKNRWIEVELGEVCEFIGGGTPSKKEPSYWNGDIPWASIKDIKGGYLTDTKDYITEKGLQNSAANVAQPEGIILATRINPGKPIRNKICAAINQDLKIVKPRIDIDNDFLYYAFLNLEGKILKVSSGTTVLGVNLNNLRDITFPLAPLPEQRAIVAKIEKLFSDLDNGTANLKTAKAKLDIYRQAILKKAFEGFPYATKMNLGEINQKIQIGPFGSQLHKEDYTEGGIPLINPMHIQNGEIRPSLSYSISTKKKASLPNYILQEGDVIMGRRGEMGRCALVTETEDGWFCGTGSLYLRPLKDKVFSPFLYYYMSSPVIKELLTGKATGTTMMNLNKKIISNLPIQLPPLQQQTQIVMEIESRLSVCDKMAESIDQSLEKAEALRQSILKKAFAGKLLSEAELTACRREPDWEPAHKLLERIQKNKSGRSAKNRKKTSEKPG